MKITVYFKPSTSSDYGARLVVNVPFIRSRPKSVGIRLTHHSPDMQILDKVEIFVRESLVSEVPKFFIGDLLALSPQIDRVEEA